MSVETMMQTAKSGAGECPSEALHHSGLDGMEAFDDVTGQALDPALMVKVRKDKIEYFRSVGVYEKVDVQECWNVTDKAPIGVRWVDFNKCDSSKTTYRRRLVAKEFNTGVWPELYAATPPSECLRIMLSKTAN